MKTHGFMPCLMAGLLALCATAWPADLPTLKDTFKDHFMVGTAINHAVATGRGFRRSPEQVNQDVALVKTQFNHVVAENEMKWALIHPRPGADGYDFRLADAFVNFGLSNDMVLVGHTLVWHSQTPSWVFAGTNPPTGVADAAAGPSAERQGPATNRVGRGRFGPGFGGGFPGRYTGPRASRDELLGRMRDHIHTVVGRYKGKVRVWDVVNEALADRGTNLLRPSLWLEIIGPDFIAKAFEYAHEADPEAMLRYNDYGLEDPAKRRKLIALIRSLQAQQVPVHAIGSQAHVNVSTTFETMDQALADIATLGLPIHITELDVTGAQGGQRSFGADIAENAATAQGGLVSDADRRQAEAYAGLFRAFLKHDRHVAMVTFWGPNDGNSWRASGKPLLFDAQCRPKPAFHAVIAAAPGASRLPPAAMRHWTADNGNGTYSNPLFYEEFEDPDIIRVGEDYYLAGTTMHMNPAVQIMHSKDLVNWELVGYCMDRLDLGPAFRLEGGDIYGRGIWAPCIRYHKGTFYVFSNVNGVGLQVFRSQSIRGPWERNQLPGRHDLSVLFDDDGTIYLISGAASPYPIEELAPDVRSFKTDAPKRALVGRMGEGHHLYKINGKYVDVSAIPGGAVDQMVAIADSIDGPWTIERMVQGESLGVTAAAPLRARPDDRGLWLHQGGIVDTPSGEWWSLIMSDHGSAGRMVALVPVTWDNGFPLIGLPGNLRRAPNTWLKPDTGHTQEPRPAFIHDDRFDGPGLNPHAQWNHVPEDSKWSLSEKPGVLRLHSLPANDFFSARNSLCQRPPGPECIITVEMDTSGLAVGDNAGLALLSWPYAWIGVVKTPEGDALQRVTGGGGRRRGPGAGVSATPKAPAISPAPPPTRLWLRVHCNFDNDEALFSWSGDGTRFTPLGEPFTMTFQLTTFQGVRPALFNFNTTGRPGGHADFDNYTCVEPRARGIERAIPIGKLITLTSGADGSFLAADTAGNRLVTIAADSTGSAPEQATFVVVDLGKGRVALQAVDGRFVSAAGDRAVLTDLGGKPPGDAESFQWINLMRGDTMLLSLATHRYLASQPNEPGPVTVTATGPTPARKGGECFRWKIAH
ncbi:MAG TPA: endo-1,4-beta-xylanase [Verrucomicrobiota bacterium]|nr:endo-1,4-beta-xylanase [Verrucomicrobiota bacterium]